MLVLFDKLSWCVNLPSLGKRSGNLQGSAKWLWPGLVNFVTSFACCFLPKLACSIHTTWTKLFSWPLYTSACKFQLPYSERSWNDQWSLPHVTLIVLEVDQRFRVCPWAYPSHSFLECNAKQRQYAHIPVILLTHNISVCQWRHGNCDQLQLQRLVSSRYLQRSGLFLYRVGKWNVTLKWINWLFGPAQTIWQFLLLPGYVSFPHSV